MSTTKASVTTRHGRQALGLMLMGGLMFASGAPRAASAPVSPSVSSKASAPASTATQKPASKGACQAEPMTNWKGYALQWSGDCVGGKASGLGALRAYGTGKPTLLYLGKMEAGRATLGVIEHPDGLMAGRFSQGALVPSDERQVTLDAFKAAEQAARQVSSRFKAAGNAASARYYQGKAAQMQNQMD